MSYLSQRILSLTKQLMPKGRAWWIPTGSDFEKFLKAFGGDGSNQIGTQERLINDGNSTIDSLIPDNDNFTDGTANPLDNDCDDGERRWGLIRYGVTSGSTPTRLQRMAAISVKMAYPGTDACRQTAAYLRNQLLAAGFTGLVVRENLTGRSPEDLIGIGAGDAGYGMFGYGDIGYGDSLALSGVSLIANNIDETIDDLFVIPVGEYHGLFFITGPVGYSDFGTVPLVRKAEFRQLILTLKSAHMCGVLVINYT